MKYQWPLGNIQAARREEKMWCGEEEVKNKIFEEIISEIFPYLMKTIKLIDSRSLMNTTKGIYKELY